MPRRLSGLPLSLGLGLLFFAGCRGDQPPRSGCHAGGCRRRMRPSQPRTPSPPREKPPRRPHRPQKPPIEITPGSSTITADDPGLQLLAARKEAGSIRDLTAEVKWSVEPPDLADIEQGGYLRPRSSGEAVVKAAFEGQTASARIKLDPRSEPLMGFRPRHRADLDPAGLQHGRLSRQGGRAEWFSSLALRLRLRTAIFWPWPATPASAGSRNSLPKRACFWPRPPDGSPMAAAPG